MRVPGLHKLIQRPGRDRGRRRRGRPAAQSRWQLAGSVAAVVTLAALATAQLPDRPPAGGSEPAGRYDAAGLYDAAGAAEASAADPFIDDEVLNEFVKPEQLVAVPVGPGRVAKLVQMVLSGAPVIKTLGESEIPDVAVRAYKQAEARLAVSDPGCGVPWTLLAAIGRVESDHGRFGGAQLRDDGSATRRIRGIPLDGRPNVALIRDSDGGALDGDAVYDRAVGPMQFIPSTWRAVNADGNGDGFADPNNMFDAAQGAAQYLCTGTSNLRDRARAAQAVRRYNNADSYVRLVLAMARMYQTGRVIGLPSTGELLPDETDTPLALRPWPTTAPPALRPWPTDAPPAVGSWPTAAPPGDTVLAKPAPTHRTEPAAPPRPVTRPRTTTPPLTQPNPLAPRPSKTAAPKLPATTSRPTINPKPSEPRPSEPKPSQPRASEAGSAGTGSPTAAPSAEPTLERKPTTAAVGWAPAMRQVVGQALARPACPQARTPQAGTPKAGTPQAGTPQAGTPQVGTPKARTPQAGTPQPDQRPGTCPAESTEPPLARDDKNRERCTPQHVCKVPSSPRTPARPGR
ncbi:lytic murein transglycosylase [Kribbella sp. NBC_01510]